MCIVDQRKGTHPFGSCCLRSFFGSGSAFPSWQAVHEPPLDADTCNAQKSNTQKATRNHKYIYQRGFMSAPAAEMLIVSYGYYGSSAPYGSAPPVRKEHRPKRHADNQLFALKEVQFHPLHYAEQKRSTFPAAA